MRQPTDEELEAVQTALDSDGQSIITAGTRLGQEAAALVLATAKPIKRLQDRLLKDAAKSMVTRDNSIDYLSTRLLTGVNTWLQEAEFLLQNIAVKGGMIQPGDPLIQALAQEVADEPKIEYMGTLVLAVKEAVPWLERIACALEIIAANTMKQPVSGDSFDMGDPTIAGAGSDQDAEVHRNAPDFVPGDEVGLEDAPLAPDASDGTGVTA